MCKNVGIVYIVGAGCGDAELISMRGAGLLAACDVVIYDDLIDTALLQYTRPGTQTIYMGKRRGHHSAPQDQICTKLIELASQGKTVVRLKGGDPYVFGRGGEEALALIEAGIPFEEIPGISSCIAIPAMAGIPVTHRGVSQSFHVMTAHSKDSIDALPADLDHLANMHGTCVFLMGLSHLGEICSHLLAAGKAPDTPAAVISDGNSPHHYAVRGTLEDITAKVTAAALPSPAVIVIGETAALSLQSDISDITKPLSGVTVGITGTDAVTQKLMSGLRSLGAQVFLAERAGIRPIHFDFSDFSMKHPVDNWIVFTSANGVDAFFTSLRKQKVDLRMFSSCKFAVIGPSTGSKLAEYGIFHDLCPGISTGAELAKALMLQADPQSHIYLFRSALGAPELYHTLSAHFPLVQDIPLYDVISDTLVAANAKARLSEADYLTFSSAGGVRLFLAEHGSIPETAKCVCIGDTCRSELQKHFSGSILLAADISGDGIMEAILEDRAMRD